MELLKKIMSSDVFSEFILVGGTALALQIGHRNSVDIDMFGQCEILPELFEKELSTFGKVRVHTSSKNIFICEIDGIKVDFVNHIYPFIDLPVLEDGIRLASPKDIAPMKLNAIEGRGSRKDFIDLYFLLDIFSLRDMIGFYHTKYPNHSDFIMLQSLNYYDAELQPSPIMFRDFSWENCKKTITSECQKLNLG